MKRPFHAAVCGRNNMNKSANILISAAALITLCGCGAEQAVKKTADSFWNEMSAGELENAKNYVTPGMFDSFDSMSSAADSLITISHEFEISEEAQKAIDEFSSNIVRVTYGDHKIISLKEISADEYEVIVSLQIASPASLQGALEGVDYQAHVDEYQNEILDIMASEGLDQAYSRMYELIFTYLNDNLNQIASGLQYYDQKAKMTLVKKDRKWLIEKIDESGSPE